MKEFPIALQLYLLQMSIYYRCNYLENTTHGEIDDQTKLKVCLPGGNLRISVKESGKCVAHFRPFQSLPNSLLYLRHSVSDRLIEKNYLICLAQLCGTLLAMGFVGIFGGLGRETRFGGFRGLKNNTIFIGYWDFSVPYIIVHKLYPAKPMVCKMRLSFPNH